MRSMHKVQNKGWPRVLVIGDVMLDAYVETKTHCLGGAANVALNAYLLGADVSLFGVIGDDDEGAVLLNLLSKHGLTSPNVIKDISRPTTLKAWSMVYGQYYKTSRESRNTLAPIIDLQIRQNLHLGLEGCDVCLISDYEKGVLSESLVKYLIGSCAELSIPVFVDTKKSDLSMYSGATLVKGNRTEFQLHTADLHSDVPLNSMLNKAQDLVHRHGLEYYVVTLDKEGMLLVSSQSQWVFSQAVTEVNCTIGAGDVAIAAMAVLYAKGDSMESSVCKANTLCGKVVQSSHTAKLI